MDGILNETGMIFFQHARVLTLSGPTLNRDSTRSEYISLGST